MYIVLELYTKYIRGAFSCQVGKGVIIWTECSAWWHMRCNYYFSKSWATLLRCGQRSHVDSETQSGDPVEPRRKYGLL